MATGGLLSRAAKNKHKTYNHLLLMTPSHTSYTFETVHAPFTLLSQPMKNSMQ